MFTAWSLSFKILIVLAVLSAVAIGAAKFTHDVVATRYQKIALEQEVAVVTREKRIAVLDTKTLARATEGLRNQLEKEQKEKEELNAIIAKHKDDPKPWCSLSEYELCVWNRANRFVFDDSGQLPECAFELPTTGTSEVR